MFFEKKKPDILKGLNYSIRTGHHQIKLLALLRDNLSEFAKDFMAPGAILKQYQNVDVKFENYVSQELNFFLNNQVNRTGYLFGFQAIGPDILVKQFGAGVHDLTLLLIEAKRLPPTSSKDYVKTGIRRFKQEEHGKLHNVAVMLGYVQKQDFNHWFNEVNSWIRALIFDESENPRWTKEEQINKIQVTDIGEYQSTHCRITEKPITLHHFWINLCNQASTIILN